MNTPKVYLLLLIQFFVIHAILAQNPLIQDQFTADPSARVFGERVYVYPSHDIPCTEGKGRIGWFCMEDYHVFSSENLKDWTDHGVILSQETVPWANPTAYSMWAPDCIERNGKYYFYFPTRSKEATVNGEGGFSIGVAVADSPTGPFEPLAKPIAGVTGIDPNVFIDKDGQAYLYWSQGHLYGARLKDNMLELASEPKILENFPPKGHKEGPWLFERAGIYYMTYPHVEKNVERLEYAVGEHPLGPFTYKGVIMDESPTGTWTNHQSIISFKNQWYLFYHHNELSPNFDKNRSIQMDSLFFNADGTIRKVIPTLRGVGITSAWEAIQLDRYSQKSAQGASIAFLDTLDRFKGWKVVLDKPNAWVKYNTVDFGQGNLKSVTIRVLSPKGGTIQLRTGDKNGPVIMSAKLKKVDNWTEMVLPLKAAPAGIQHLVVTLEGNQPVEIDWIKFAVK